MQDIIIVCEDLFGLEVYDILEWINDWHQQWGKAIPYQVLGYISDAVQPFGTLPVNLKRLGNTSDWKPLSNEKYVIGLQMPDQKKRAVEMLKTAGCRFETVCAPWMLYSQISIGEGSVIAAYSIKDGMTIGKYVTIIGAMLTYRSIGDYSTIMRFCNLSGNVGEYSYVGNHVYTHLAKEIGDHCFVSDGSVVVRNIKSGTTVSGVPAKKI